MTAVRPAPGALDLPALPGPDPTATHEVTNQASPLLDYDVADEPVLLAGLEREGAGWHAGDLHRLGRLAGGAQAARWASDANVFGPRLMTHDRYGHRIDEVEFHPAWHELLTVAVGEGLAGAPWADPRPGAHVARAAGFYVWSQVEGGHGCPVSMTYSSVPVLRRAPEIAAGLEPLLTSRSYDPGLRPLTAKSGILAGMGMTEKQGGSDVRANSTEARPLGRGAYLLRGHKWFTSAPMCDVFLFLADVPGRGISCFLVPRVLPDGTRNRLHLMRLKDKLGNRSNASSEVELADAVGLLVGEEGRGIRTILDMVALTRLDCVIGSAALMRIALAQALHHARHRDAFGSRLADKPLMQAVLADLALESAASTALMLRLAGAADRAAAGDEQERAFQRVATAVGKFWVCKRASGVVAEALECLGGNGYVEDSGLPRLYREAPLNSIWEGSGNVNALDVLRACGREPQALEALLTELGTARGLDPRFDAALDEVAGDLTGGAAPEGQARHLVGRLALLLQAAALLAGAPAEVSEAFLAARLAPQPGPVYGALPPGLAVSRICDWAGANLPV